MKQQNNTFTEFGLQEDLLKAIDNMGFERTTPVQAKTIAPFLKGHDLVVQAPTGSGKTAAFGVPVSQMVNPGKKGTQTLILSPTRELAIQIAKVMKNLNKYRKNVVIATLYGGEKIQKQFGVLLRKPQIIIATPGRLLDHLQRGTVRLDGLNTLVLDEADRMLDMGFRKDMDKIVSAISGKHQTVMFSATLSKEIMAITKKYQTNAQQVAVKQESLTVKSVKQFYTKVDKGEKKSVLVSLLESSHYPLSIIFVNTKRMADRLSKSLKNQGFRSGALHGDMDQHKRDRVMQAFRSGQLEVLVATDVAARGIDVKNIDIVINYDIPNDSDCYVHRIGRTGRADQKGIALTLIYKQEMGRLKEVMHDTHATITPKESMVSAG